MVRLNGKGRDRAVELIDAGNVNRTASWSFSASDENALLGDPPDWGFYAKHFLGVDDERSEDTKARYAYPFAKRTDGGVKLYRSALVAIRTRSAQQGHTSIFDAAGALIERVDAEDDESEDESEGETEGDPGRAGHEATAASASAVADWLDRLKRGEVASHDFTRSDPRGPRFSPTCAKTEVRTIEAGGRESGKVLCACDADGNILHPFEMLSRLDVPKGRIVFDENSRRSEADEIVTEWYEEGYIVQRPFYQMLLLVDGADLSVLNDDGGLLVGHDDADQVGATNWAAWVGPVGARRGRAGARFGRSERAVDIKNDVADKIRKRISVGFYIDSWWSDPQTKWGPDKVIIVTKWTPVENSLCLMGAVKSARVISTPGLSAALPAAELAGAAPVGFELSRPATIEEGKEVSPEEILAAERERVKNIATLGKRFEHNEMAQKFIESGQTAEAFRDALLDELGPDRAPMRPAPASAALGLSRSDAERFSILRAIRALEMKDWKLAPFELEVSQATAKKLGKEPAGFYIPMDVLTRPRRAMAIQMGPGGPTARAWSPGMREGFALDTATGAAGGYLVPTVQMIENLIELLRAQIMLSMLGARTLTDLVGDVAIPSKATGVATFWVAESGNVTEDTALTFGQVLLEPKTVGTAVKFSRRLMVQAAADVEALLEEEIAEAIATEIDLQGIQGDGTGNKPTGIISTVGVGAQAFAALGNPTWVETLGLWSDVAAANALRGTLAWLAPPPVAANMMARDKATNAGRFVWENGRVMEFPAYATSQMPANKLLFGNYRDVLIGLWGALDLNLDTVTYGLAGGRRLIAHQDVDVKLRHAASFSVGSGGT